MLRMLTYLGRRAGLHGEFKLPKFRKIYATLQHRDGVDARTIQKPLNALQRWKQHSITLKERRTLHEEAPTS
jgi:hypothetical protein